MASLLVAVSLAMAPAVARSDDGAAPATAPSRGNPSPGAAVYGGAESSRHGLQEWGIKLGYGASQRGQAGMIPVYAHFGWSLPDVVDQPLRRHGLLLNWLVEPWIAGIHSPKEDAVEAGVNPVTLKLSYDGGQQFVPYLQGGIGVMLTGLQAGLQLGGPFEFDETVGAGIDMFCTRDYSLTLAYRFRHMSNASLSSDNRGLDTHYVLFGFNLMPGR